MLTYLKERKALYPQDMEKLGFFEVYEPRNPYKRPGQKPKPWLENGNYEENWIRENKKAKVLNDIRIDVYAHLDLNKNKIAEFFYHNIELPMQKAMYNSFFQMEDNEMWYKFVSHGIAAHIFEDDEKNVYTIIGEYSEQDFDRNIDQMRADVVFIYIWQSNSMLMGHRPTSIFGKLVNYRKDLTYPKTAVFDDFMNKFQIAFPCCNYDPYCFNLDLYEHHTERSKSRESGEIPPESITYIDNDGLWVGSNGKNSFGLPGYINFILGLGEYDGITIFFDMIMDCCNEMVVDFPEYNCRICSPGQECLRLHRFIDNYEDVLQDNPLYDFEIF